MGSTGDVGRGERGLRLVLCFSARDKTVGIGPGRTERGEDLWAAYLGFWQRWPVVYQGVPAGYRGRGRVMSRGGRLGKDGLRDPQEMWARGRKAAAGVLLPC